MQQISFKIGTFLVAAFFCCISIGQVRGESCMGKFKDVKEFEALMKSCQDKLGLKDEDISKNPIVDLPKNGYDDKCYYKCILTEIKYLKPDGTLDMKYTEEDFKKNAPADKSDALIAILKTCAETTSKDPIAKDPCKGAALMKMCYLKEESKVC